jgi:hypothetical protein
MSGQNLNQRLEKRLYKIASEADATNPGHLDNPAGRLKYMPQDLRHIRHYDFFVRHRVFITGSHKNCSYDAVYIKEFKRDGVLTEGSAKFDRILRNALADDTFVVLENPNVQNNEQMEAAE